MAETVTPPAPSPAPAAAAPTPAPAASPASQGASGDDNKVPGTWDEIFKHPRFTELIATKNEALTKVQTFEKEKNDAATQKEIEAGNFQKVIDGLKPQAERAEKLDATIKKIVAAETAQIPEARRSLIPNLPPEDQLDWITANRAFLMDDGNKKKTDVNKPTSPGGGSPGGDNKRIFTQAEISDAKFYEANRTEILLAQKEGRIQG